MESTLAARLVELIVANLERPWPHKPGYVLDGEADLCAPRERHPIFHGCFDWHSAVHSHWALARLLRANPRAPWAEDAAEVLDARLSPAAIAAEADFLARAPGFEQPYGTAWLLTLCGELAQRPQLARRVEPLTAVARERFLTWLGRLPGPIRSGQHDQSAFAMTLARDWAEARGDHSAREAIDERARAFYGADVDAPIAYEPSAHDFLSPALAEAELMSQVLPGAELTAWLTRFLPNPRLEPVHTRDGSDGKLAHFSGLNLSRAWMAARISRALAHGPVRASFEACASAHARDSWTPGDAPPYAESHWVPSFVVYHRLSAIS